MRRVHTGLRGEPISNSEFALLVIYPIAMGALLVVLDRIAAAWFW